jgi:2',3'-cyclic-nucleotide 2'-phosphodiesterase (5'-nucleotidase family)
MNITMGLTIVGVHTIAVSAHMIELLNALKVDFVVLGNHEFDFGEDLLMDLLSEAKFTVFGSNVRLSATGELLPGVTDIMTRQLPNGAVLGVFGVTTSNSALDSNASDAVSFESEVEHTRRCVALLKARGADVVVALTHVSVPVDRLIARSVSGIDLILGGHDHEAMTMVEHSTIIHKSGQDVLWLGRINLRIGLSPQQHHVDDDCRKSRAEVSIDWQMYMNRGYAPDPVCQSIHRSYKQRVAASQALDKSETGNEVPLATLKSVLDGTKATLRCGESNLGNLVADAMLAVYDADITILNAGAIPCERMFVPPIKLTRTWVNSVVSNRNHVAVIRMTVQDLERALLAMLARYPSPNPSHPQVSGAFVVLHDVCNRITAVDFFRDRECTQKIAVHETLLVVTTDFVRDYSEARAFFSERNGITKHVFQTDEYIQDVVEDFLKKRGVIDYPLHEQRQRVEWTE